jgi:FAD/FMN-containing dehydrogenase
MIATNAGGLHVIRYGPMRSRVIGLEAVLADGTVISHLAGLLKDNTGYDLSQLLIGSEGTLAVITAARLSLVPDNPQRVVVLMGLESTGAAVEAIETLRRDVEGVQAAEVFFDDGLELVRSHAGLSQPLKGSYRVYLLVEAAGRTDCSEALFESLANLDVAEEATAVALDTASMAALWQYRERHTEAVSALGIPHKLDVTLPHARLGDFEVQVRALVARESPDSTLVLFGHVGDGNFHVNIVGPPPSDETIDERVLELVASMGGSISAEHGIGRAKARWLHLSRSASEIETMRAIKAALDPAMTLNPDVLFYKP